MEYSEDGEQVIETHVLATVDIPEGSYVLAQHTSSSLFLPKETIKGIHDMGGSAQSKFLQYVDKFGHSCKYGVDGYTAVEIGATNLIQMVTNEEDANVGRWIPPHPEGKRPKYSPVYDRHYLSFNSFMVATKDIPKGGELFKSSNIWEI